MDHRREQLDPAEERAITKVLERLERAGSGEAADGTRQAYEREYTELLGLLAGELEPVAPSPGVRERLLRAVKSEATVVPLRGAMDAQAAPQPSTTPLSRYLMAAMVVLSLGLTAVASWLGASLVAARADTEALVAEMEAQESTAAELAAFRQELQALKNRFTLVTGPGVEICALKPRPEELVQPEARGHLYVSPGRDRWLLTAHSLEPCDGQKAYHVWFLTDDGPVSGGSFHVAPGEKIEIGSDEMPDGSRAIFVTLESSESPSEPTGPTVLYGDQAAMVL